MKYPYFDTTACYGTPGVLVGIRQDTSAKKVFAIFRGDTTEQLLYDFNLQVGDTVKGFIAHYCVGSHSDIITSIDSILIGSDYRKRWRASPNGWQMIEGIGSTWDLITVPCGGAWQDGLLYNLICFQQDGTVLYSNSTWGYHCDIIDAVINLTEKNIEVNISPNPFHSSSLLQVSSEFANAKLNIYNSLGSLVREERISNQKTFVLNRNELHNGIYFLQLINDRGQMITEKLIVE